MPIPKDDKANMTEIEIKNKICPYLSKEGELKKCIGSECMAFTVTKTVSKETYLIFSDSEKEFQGTGKHFYLDSKSYPFFVQNHSWITEVEYNNATYVHDHPHQKKLSHSDNTGHYTKYEKMASCEGYCFLCMHNEKIILPL